MSYKDKKVVRLDPDIYRFVAGQANREFRSVNAQVEYMLKSMVITPTGTADASTPATNGHTQSQPDGTAKMTANHDAVATESPKARPARKPRPVKRVAKTATAV